MPSQSASSERRSDTRDKLHATVSSAIEAQILSGTLSVGDKLQSESAIARKVRRFHPVCP